MSDPSLGTALWSAATAIGDLGATAAANLGTYLNEHPDARLPVILLTTGAAVAIALYWFIDGVRNWRRKCIPCRGRGAFNSKLSKRLDRPCSCCGGTGRHTTVRKRMVRRLRSSS